MNVIESLDADEYDILHKFYVQSFNLPEIAQLYDKSYTWAHKLHTSALNSVQNILNKRTK